MMPGWDQGKWQSRKKRKRKKMGNCPGRVTGAGCTCDGSCARVASGSCACGACLAHGLAFMSGGSGGNVITPGGGGGSVITSGGSNGGVIMSGGGGGSTGGSPPARPRHTAPPGHSRNGSAGMSGFAEREEKDFELAIGSVHGLRRWNFPVRSALDKALYAGTDPSTSLLITTSGGAPGPLLTGMTGQSWSPGVNEARCNNHAEHKPPVEWDENRGQSCGCGYWCYWSLSGDSAFGSGLPILGVAEGTGRVLIGEKGFRSQKARIIAMVPAFTIEATASLARVPRGSYSDPVFGTYAAPDEDRAAAEKRERELAEARDRAQAWMAVIMEALGELYPDARIFSTVRGMLASVRLGEIT